MKRIGCDPGHSPKARCRCPTNSSDTPRGVVICLQQLAPPLLKIGPLTVVEMVWFVLLQATLPAEASNVGATFAGVTGLTG